MNNTVGVRASVAPDSDDERSCAAVVEQITRHEGTMRGEVREAQIGEIADIDHQVFS